MSPAVAAEAELQPSGDDPKTADACFALAALCKDRGLNRQAAALFRKVLALAPGHPGAAEELRVLPLV